MPVAEHTTDTAHCYLWVPNALLPWGLLVLDAWGFEYLRAAGFDIATRDHAKAILVRDFPEPLAELCTALAAVSIPDVELIRGGGGESPLTALTDADLHVCHSGGTEK